MSKKRVLILCTGNSCRSQMAEGLINHFLGDKWEAYSAGTHPSRLNPYAIRAMNDIGIDISNQQSEGVEKYLHQPLDLVITVCSDADQNCPVFPGNVARTHIDLMTLQTSLAQMQKLCENFTGCAMKYKIVC